MKFGLLGRKSVSHDSALAALAPMVPRYRQLREAGVSLTGELVKTLSKSELEEGAKKLGFWVKGTFVFNSEDETVVLMDYCLHDVWREGRNAIQRYLAVSPPPERSDERFLLEGWAASHHSFYVVEQIERGVGVLIRDFLYGGSVPVMDINFSKSVSARMALVVRVGTVDGIPMSTGAGLPADGTMLEKVFAQLDKMLPNGPTLPELPRQRRSEVTAAIIRTCLASGASEHIRYQSPDEPVGSGRRDLTGGLFSGPDRGLVAEPAVRAEARVGRNDPCPCGSGRKYKKCCGGAGGS